MIAYMFQKYPENFAFQSLIKTRTAMNVKILIFVIYVEAIMYLLLRNFYVCTFKLA